MLVFSCSLLHQLFSLDSNLKFLLFRSAVEPVLGKPSSFAVMLLVAPGLFIITRI